MEEILLKLGASQEFEERVTDALKNQFAPQITRLAAGHGKVFPPGGSNLVERVEKLEARPACGSGKSRAPKSYDFGFGAKEVPETMPSGADDLKERMDSL